MSPWVLRGLRDGVVTTRWPRRPDAYAGSLRGPATVRDPQEADPRVAGPGQLTGLERLCPTGAITVDGSSVRLDQGRCILCGRCAAERPDVFDWQVGPAAAALTREGLVVPDVPESDENLEQARAGLRARTAALRRSVHIRHVDAGSDGAEEQEIQALLNPVYDVHRLGIFITASPRHADVLLVTGAGSRGMTEPLRRAHAAMPDPKLVIAVGTDAVSGGLTSPSYATTGGIGATVPVDVWLPGSPPSPFSILHALLLALGRLPAGERAAAPSAGVGRGAPGGGRRALGRRLAGGGPGGRSAEDGR